MPAGICVPQGVAKDIGKAIKSQRGTRPRNKSIGLDPPAQTRVVPPRPVVIQPQGFFGSLAGVAEARWQLTRRVSRLPEGFVALLPNLAATLICCDCRR